MDIIPYKKLPEKARNFIETYFSDYYVFKVTFSSSYSKINLLTSPNLSTFSCNLYK